MSNEDTMRIRIADLEKQRGELLGAIAIIAADRNEILANLTATQTRCTELIQEVRELKARPVVSI